MFKLLCRLKWAGLLPFARLVESTREDLELNPRHEVIETERKMTLNRALLTGLVDRWRPKTHTFHFRWGEMAPTLQDVSYLLGLPLSSHPIGPLNAPRNWAADLLARFNGVHGGVAFLDIDSSHGPKYAWLKEFQVYYCIVISCNLFRSSVAL
jgi:hypothetical protein